MTQSRLKDPNDHFPYKRDDAVRGGVPADVADATAAYIDAQAALLKNKDESTITAYRAARDRLVQVRGGRRGTELTIVAEGG